MEWADSESTKGEVHPTALDADIGFDCDFNRRRSSVSDMYNSATVNGTIDATQRQSRRCSAEFQIFSE